MCVQTKHLVRRFETNQAKTEAIAKFIARESLPRISRSSESPRWKKAAPARKYVTAAKAVTVHAGSLMPSNPTLSKQHPLELRPRSFVVLAPLCPAGVNAARRCDLLRFLFLLRPTSFKRPRLELGTTTAS